MEEELRYPLDFINNNNAFISMDLYIIFESFGVGSEGPIYSGIKEFYPGNIG